MPEIYYTSTDPVFGKMTMKQFIETEIKERGNYSMADVQNWMKKYNLSMNDLAIWVSPKKWVANRYNLLAEEWDEAEKIPESQMSVYEIKGNEGFIIPESDDGDEGYLFVFKPQEESKLMVQPWEMTYRKFADLSKQPTPTGFEKPSHIGEIRTFWAYPKHPIPGRVKTAQQIEAERLLGVDLDNFDVYEFTTWTELVETKHPELKQIIKGHMISRHLKADDYAFVKRFLRGMELPTALQIPGALPVVPSKAPAAPPAAKPVQSIHEIKQQVMDSIHAAGTVEELQPILKGIGFLPLPEPEKRQVMDAYQNRYSILMTEIPFGAPVKTGEEKPRVLGVPTPQQRFEEEQRKKAAESAFRGQQKLTSGASVTKRLSEFGIKEKMLPEMTSSMHSYIQGAVPVKDVIHHYRDGRPPTRGVLYRARDKTYFVEAQDGQFYASMGWEGTDSITVNNLP